MGRKVAIAVTVGAVVLGSISSARAAGMGIEDVFDERYYADMYPDLKAAYGYDRAALLEHFKKIGLSEGRVMNEMLDVVKYREKYPDLQDAFGDDWDAYVAHYLTYGAFEHRDSGTGFDPVDYLERYGDLKEAYGNDILAAYRHYEEFGKQEGREARSEAVVRAEEAALGQGSAMGSSKPAEGSSKPEEEPSGPAQEAFEIRNVEVMGSGRIRVTLNRKTEQPLTLSAFSILCNSGGSDMTVLAVSTEDNMVYDLSTAYYRDQEYDIQITFPDGMSISRVFAYRTDCAQIAGMNAVRTEADRAVITYNADEPGYFYYILRESGQSRARAASSTGSDQAAEPTEAELIKDGIKTEMKQHENTITAAGLTGGMPYTMYYVAVNGEGKSTPVNSLFIAGDVYEETAAAIKSAKAFAEKQETGEFLYGFEIELETATAESLTLGQFDISCPLSETKLGKVRTTDNKIYRVYMQRGTVPKGNNTYTILINLKDGTQLKGTCYLDLQAPRISIRSIEWQDENTIKVTVNSDEAGMLYYAVQDRVEGAGTTAPKDPAQLYAGGTRVAIGYGLNYITVSGVQAGQWFCAATEDERGNREEFYDYKEIPIYEASAPDQDEEAQLRITEVTVIRTSDKAKIKVVLNQSVMGRYENTMTQITGLSGDKPVKKLMLDTVYGNEGSLTDNVLTMTILDSSISIPAGNHTLTVFLDEGATFVTYDFTVE